MTSIAGYNLNTTPCCGEVYTIPRYRSMNFMASEYWTDGYRGGSLMPNGHGLCQCKCGNYYLMNEMHPISQSEELEAPYTMPVTPEDLPDAIAKARTTDIERAARLTNWQHLNHPYRERYRAHRDAEEAATRAAWETKNPDLRTWWQKLRKVEARPYIRPESSPFTYPPHELNAAQRENLNALLNSQKKFRIDSTIRAELHRQLGQFEQAEKALQDMLADKKNVTQRLIKRLIKEEVTAPMRYRM